MYEILIKTQPSTEYVEITGEDLVEFSTYTDLFLSIANDSNSPYYVDNSEVWRRLCSCIEQVMVIIPGYCLTIFDSSVFQHHQGRAYPDSPMSCRPSCLQCCTIICL